MQLLCPHCRNTIELARLTREEILVYTNLLATAGNETTNRLIGWHHSRRGRFKGTSLFYKPVTAKDLRRSYLQAEDEKVAAADAVYYRSLALSRATGWDRVALAPLAVRSGK